MHAHARTHQQANMSCEREKGVEWCGLMSTLLVYANPSHMTREIEYTQERSVLKIGDVCLFQYTRCLPHPRGLPHE